MKKNEDFVSLFFFHFINVEQETVNKNLNNKILIEGIIYDVFYRSTCAHAHSPLFLTAQKTILR